MELNIKTYNKINNFIDDAKKNKNYELEARFWGRKDKNLINEENYNKVFQKLTFSKENNGFGFKFTMRNILDVILDKSSIENDADTIRMSINDKDNIKKYWLNIDFDKIDKIFIEKEKLDKIDEENYNIRFSLNNELPQTNMLDKNKNLLSSINYDKTYRLKNRYSIYTDDKLFVIDMSSIKLGTGKSFKESNTLNESLKYEIEIEFIGKDENISNDEITKKLIYYCEIILKILQNSDILISNNQINNLKKNYQNIIKSNNNDYFIAASPVTIHREFLFKTDQVNILNRYAVTLKADGERYLLMVNKDGKIYIFNNAFKFIDTGYEDKEWINTLIEGEYIESNKELYMYDILFSKSEDVRRRYLIDIREGKIKTRLELINQFEKSNSRKISSLFNEQTSIKILRKKYLQSVRQDGSDIFDKVKEIWNSKQFNNFNVDGVIFVPKYEHYPMRGGPWRALFKWKPPHLNTIDFLIKTFKDDNNRDIKYPFIDVVKRLDKKEETVLKQYKMIQLYVTDEKTIYQNQKSFKKKYPALFNPFNIDNSNSEIYNTVKIFIDDDEKMYAIDPITNEKSEILDNTIVEFGYDDTREVGFKWIPHKLRKDKTFLYKSGKDMFGNNKYIANDNFRAIQSPITEEMIITGNIPLDNKDDMLVDTKQYYERNNSNTKRRLPYQNFHNHYIKYYLLQYSSPSYIQELSFGYSGKLLDLCCGRGVDINKIKKARYAEVIGMDIDYKNIIDAQELFKSMIIPPPKAYYIRGDSSKLIFPEQASAITESDKIYTKKYIPAKYLFDTVSLQFCFHYFFENEISLRTIIQNINDNLKIGGFVIGTTFDGERVNNLFKHNDSVSGKTENGETMWKIDKKYTSTKIGFTSSKPNYGKQIDVLVKTIGVVHPEYLVNFNYLDKIMMDYGFSKVFVKPFEDFYNELMEGKNVLNVPEKDFKQNVSNAESMTEDQKKYSFLNSAFMYKKEKNSSDSLMQKLVELMEKKNKLKKTEDLSVFNVNKDTETIIEDEELGER